MPRPPARLASLARNSCFIILALTASVLTGKGGVLYGTGFETTNSPPFTAGVGSAASPKLVGTDNWTMVVNPSSLATSTGYPSAGIDSGLVPGMGQTAALGYLGATPPPSSAQFIRVGRKVASEPVLVGNQPIIDFYCQIGLTQSTNSRYDDFELLVYNWNDQVLGGLTFDLTQNELFRYDANEFNTSSSVSPYTATGLSLSSLYGTVVEVTMHINYQTNTWSATVGGVQVITGAPFTQRPTSGTNSAPRTFGSLSARWYITTVGYPGNNWMLFDDWTISASAEPSIPAAVSAGYAANSTANITVTDADSVGWTLTSSAPTWAVVSPATGTGTATVTATCALNATASPRAAVLTVGTQTCTLTQAASPFAAWAAGLPAGQQDFSQDADGDGVTNGIEYALGRNATSATGINGFSQLPVITASTSGTPRQLTLTLSLPEPAPSDIVYDIQVANDLTNWTTIMEKSGTGPWSALGNSGATVVATADGSGRSSFAITDALGFRFMRLAVACSSVVTPVTSVPATASALYTASASATIQVTSNSAWTAASDQVWAQVSPQSATGNATVTVTCAANAGLARSASITIGGQTCLLTQAAAPYALWAAALPTGQQDFSQDADGDGVTNGMEYALGRVATSAAGVNGAAQLPVFAWSGSGASRLPALAINLPTTVPADLTFDVEVSNTTAGPWITIIEKSANNPWTVIGNSGATVNSTAAGTGRTLHLVADSQSHKFLRLKVTKMP